MPMVVCTDDEPAVSRLDYWRHIVGDTVVPLDMSADSSGGYRGRLVGARFSTAQFAELTASPLRVSRTRRLIHRSDPGLYKIEMHTRGCSVLVQAGQETLLRPGDIAVVDTGRPYQMAAGYPTASTQPHVPDGRLPQLVTLMVPYGALPLSVDAMAPLSGVGLAARVPTAGIAAATLGQLARAVTIGDEVTAAGLAGVVVDLLAIGIASATQQTSTVEPETHRRGLLYQLQAFIAEHLAEPELSATTVAAAHHISVRSLQRVFQSDGETVAEWIRRRRLEHCRLDLADQALRQRPVAAIARRWGFTNASHFNRLFRAAYGLAPGTYRRVHQTSVSVPASRSRA